MRKNFKLLFFVLFLNLVATSCYNPTTFFTDGTLIYEKYIRDNDEGIDYEALLISIDSNAVNNNITELIIPCSYKGVDNKGNNKSYLVGGVKNLNDITTLKSLTFENHKERPCMEVWYDALDGCINLETINFIGQPVDFVSTDSNGSKGRVYPMHVYTDTAFNRLPKLKEFNFFQNNSGKVIPVEVMFSKFVAVYEEPFKQYTIYNYRVVDNMLCYETCKYSYDGNLPSIIESYSLDAIAYPMGLGNEITITNPELKINLSILKNEYYDKMIINIPSVSQIENQSYNPNRFIINEITV